ncbi:MAG: type II CRISPR RNA-guided endonuclease Cas9 [Cyanobacteria bacterium NC_groundwater_1444_Ag_S-0.65um_54_12]|nr:type II CRISPR RNA-guided endonuclease Cas9 [Cyanobacteria bacterium NC_groundwater_1444_Ag_S-0.65um_54_12]
MYTLGLDIGMASVGAALLTRDKILALHVRTFDKAETEKGEPLNLVRRLARGTRRRLRRRAYRLLKLARLFKRRGLIQKAAPESFCKHGPRVWDLRAAGLDRKLEPTEWAAVLYHLCKHRGFQSTRKTEGSADKDVTAMLKEIRKNIEQLQIGYRTPGEMAVRAAKFAPAKRNKSGTYVNTFPREAIQDELTKLFLAQRSFGNSFAESDVEEKVRHWLMARRPALSGDSLKKMVGKCTFERNETRAARATFSAERFIWLSSLNNLRIFNRGKSRALTPDERNKLIDLPFEQSKLTFKQIRKQLALGEDDRFNRVIYRPGAKAPEEATFFEAKAYHERRKAYEKAGLQCFWERDCKDHVRLDVLGEELTYGKQDDEIRKKLLEHGIEPAIVEAVLEVSFEKFIQLSLKALQKITPHLLEGLRYDEAVVKAGYHHSQIAQATPRQTSIPPPDPATIRNPVVYRALNQARKLVNAIVKAYGPPAAVHIELARDLARSSDERQKIKREQDKFRKQKAEAVREFKEYFKEEPRKDNLQKYRVLSAGVLGSCRRPCHAWLSA